MGVFTTIIFDMYGVMKVWEKYNAYCTGYYSAGDVMGE